MKKNLSLTGIRGIAVLLVFTAHTPIRHLIGDFGQEAVYIFFFLSAYLLTISLEKQTLKTYFTKRFWRIYPLYFIVVLVVGVLQHFKVKDLMLNLVFLQQINGNFIIDVSWSLIIEVQLYLLLPFIVWILKKYEIKALLIIVIFTYSFRIINIGLYIEHVQNGSMKVLFGNIIEVLDIFAISSYLAIHRNKIKSFDILNKLFIQIFLILLFFLIPFMLESLNVNRAISIIYIVIPIYTILIAFIFISIISGIKNLNTLFSWKINLFFGEISYGFYLIHIPILTYFKTLDINIILQGGLAFICIVTISYLSYNLFEKKLIK